MKKILSIIAAFLFVFLTMLCTSFAAENSSVQTLIPNEVHIDQSSIQDVSVSLAVYGSSISSIANGSSFLKPVVDYAVKDNTVTIKKSYLTYYYSNFGNRSMSLIFNFADGSSSRLLFYTGTYPHPVLETKEGIYNIKYGQDVLFKLSINGNAFSITNKETGYKLNGNEYSYYGDAGLVIYKSYLANEFKKSFSPLSLQVVFSGDEPQTIVITPVSLDPEITPKEVRANFDNLTDIPVTMDTHGCNLSAIMNGTGVLITDFTVNGNVVTIKRDYLKYYFAKFPDQNLRLTFKFNSGSSEVLTIFRGDSPHVVVDSNASYNIKAGEDASFKTSLNGNFITGIAYGDTSLIPRIDYTYSTVTHEIIIRKGYLAYYFSKTDNPLSLTVNFTGDSPKTLFISPTNKLTLSDGLVAHYEFEGNALDTSGNGFNGVETGNVKYVDGVKGKALDLDGKSSVIIADNPKLDSKNFSIGCYVKVKSYPSGIIFNKESQYETAVMTILAENDLVPGNLGFAINNDWGWCWQNGNFTPELNKYFHLVLTFDSDTKIARVFINGVKQKELLYSSALAVSNSPLVIGNRSFDVFFTGNIDDFRVYNRALSETEVKDLYDETH